MLDEGVCVDASIAAEQAISQAPDAAGAEFDGLRNGQLANMDAAGQA